jgi:hypothetical protein
MEYNFESLFLEFILDLTFFLLLSSFFWLAPTVAKYAITFFVFSVLPAPDSPLWTQIRIK